MINVKYRARQLKRDTNFSVLSKQKSSVFYLGDRSSLLDGVDSNHSDSVAWNDLLTQIPEIMT